MSNHKHSDEDFTDAVKTSFSVAGVLAKLGLKGNGGAYKVFEARVKSLGLDTAHFTGQGHLKGKTHTWSTKQPLGTFLIANAPKGLASSTKARIIKEGLLEYKCVGCGLTNIWNGKSIVLQIDHINGDHFDHRIENLRLLCPNCHSQTPTFGRKNKPPSSLASKTPPAQYAPKPKKVCVMCGGKISASKYAYCGKCYNEHQSELRGTLSNNTRVSKVVWPSLQELKDALSRMTKADLGRSLGVSGQAIGQRIKRLESSQPVEAIEYHFSEMQSVCERCGENTLSADSKYCRDCYDNHRSDLQTPYAHTTKINWPLVVELKERLKTSTYVALGKELGVSDVSVKKRIRYHEAKEAISAS